MTEPSTSLAPGMVLSAKAFGPSVPPWCAPLWAWPLPEREHAVDDRQAAPQAAGQHEVVGGVVVVFSEGQVQLGGKVGHSVLRLAME